MYQVGRSMEQIKMPTTMHSEKQLPKREENRERKSKGGRRTSQSEFGRSRDPRSCHRSIGSRHDFRP